MNNFELISEFLDGNLSSIDEEQLFSSLSSDIDLRLELKQQMAIKNAIRSDIMAYTPKSSSTLAIFDELGLIFPAPVAVGLGTKFVQFFQSNASYIYTSLLSALIAVVVTILLLDFNSGNSNANFTSNNGQYNTSGVPVMSSFEGNSISKDNMIDSNLNKNNFAENGKNNKEDNSEARVVYKYIYVADKDLSDKNSANNMRSNNTELDKSKLLLNDFSPNNSDMAMQNTISNSRITTEFPSDISLRNLNQQNLFNTIPQIDYNNYFSDFLDDINSDFSFELHGASYQAESSSNVLKNDFSLLNTSATLLYNLDDEFKLGVEYRRERFYQEFSGSELGNMFDYRQEPNFETYSLMLRYNPNYLKFSKFSPFVAVNLGANVAGIVPRLAIGTDLYVSSSIYFNFAYDYSTLLYKQGEANFLSNKSGLHFGAGFNF